MTIGRWLPVLLACALAAPAVAQDRSALTNLDFEQGTVDSFPPAWRAASALRRGFRVTVTDRNPHGGRFAALIQRDTLLYERDPGALIHRLDARPYRGRRVRLGGWLRYESPRRLGSANLYLRVYREGDRAGYYGDTEGDPVRGPDWVAREVVGEVALDADSIAFGAYLDREGRAYVDELSLTVLGPIGEGDQSPRPLSDRGVRNLAAFARLLGHVRFFHPSDEAAATDWAAFAIAGVDEVEDARNPAELAERLESLFRPIAPTVRVSARPLPGLDPARLSPDATHPGWKLGWWHAGWNGGSEVNTQGPYRARRLKLAVGASSDSVAAIGAEVNGPLGGGVWCSVPLTLFADSAGSLPRATPRLGRPRRPEGWIPSGRDRGTRLAGVILFWSVAKEFYPYFDVTHVDWPAELPDALRHAARDRDAIDYERTLARLVAQLRDGHGAIEAPFERYLPPLRWRFVGDRLVITRADSTRAGRIRAGDEVVAIAGRPLGRCVRDVAPMASAATPQYARERIGDLLAQSFQPDTVALDLRTPGGERYRQRVPRTDTSWSLPARPDSVTTVAPGVMYLDLHRLSSGDFYRLLPRLVESRGIIFDMRGYPWRIGGTMLAHLTDTTFASAQWHVPIVTRPDLRPMVFDSSRSYTQSQAPRIRARIAFLIDASAISMAETVLGIVEHYRFGELVGESTAGTNGNVATVRLPGGYTVWFTGMKVLKHDGSQHHGVGIQPTIPVSPTLAGIAAGRDEQLERAIEVVSR